MTTQKTVRRIVAASLVLGLGAVAAKKLFNFLLTHKIVVAKTKTSSSTGLTVLVLKNDVDELPVKPPSSDEILEALKKKFESVGFHVVTENDLTNPNFDFSDFAKDFDIEDIQALRERFGFGEKAKTATTDTDVSGDAWTK